MKSFPPFFFLEFQLQCPLLKQGKIFYNTYGGSGPTFFFFVLSRSGNDNIPFFIPVRPNNLDRPSPLPYRSHELIGPQCNLTHPSCHDQQDGRRKRESLPKNNNPFQPSDCFFYQLLVSYRLSVIPKPFERFDINVTLGMTVIDPKMCFWACLSKNALNRSPGSFFPPPYLQWSDRNGCPVLGW